MFHRGQGGPLAQRPDDIPRIASRDLPRGCADQFGDGLLYVENRFLRQRLLKLGLAVARPSKQELSAMVFKKLGRGPGGPLLGPMVEGGK